MIMSETYFFSLCYTYINSLIKATIDVNKFKKEKETIKTKFILNKYLYIYKEYINLTKEYANHFFPSNLLIYTS